MADAQGMFWSIASNATIDQEFWRFRMVLKHKAAGASDRAAYREIVNNKRMTVPAILLGVAVAFLSSINGRYTQLT